MRVGITILTDLPWAEARPRWQAVEEMGFDHAWTYDHLVWGGLPESPWTTATPVLGAVAQVTSRLGLGTLVASPNFRHPYLLFRDAQALDDLSDGRFLLGVGTGGDLDSRVLGQPPLTVGQRVERFQEFTRVLAALRDGDHLSHAGVWYSTDDARTLPPLRRTPLLVAANGPRSLRFAAEVGDGWITTGPYTGTVEEWWAGVEAAVATYDEALASTGREATPRYLMTDSADRFALSSRGFFEEVAGRAAELGFTDLVSHWPRDDSPYAGDVAVLEEVAAEVLPGLRQRDVIRGRGPRHRDV